MRRPLLLLRLDILLWPCHGVVHHEVLLLLPGPRHLVPIGDTVQVAMTILTTADACTFETLWSGTDLGRMTESSAPFTLVHAAHRRVGWGWRFPLVPPGSVRTTVKWPPDPPFWRYMMRGMVVLLLLDVMRLMWLRLLLLAVNILLLERSLPHLPTDM